MVVLKKDLVIRGVLFMFVFVLLSVSSASYKHAVPMRVAKYISLQHELRRILGKAERENFRSAMVTEEAITVSDLCQNLAKIWLSSELCITQESIASIKGSLFVPTHTSIQFSPVLNL